MPPALSSRTSSDGIPTALKIHLHPFNSGAGTQPARLAHSQRLRGVNSSYKQLLFPGSKTVKTVTLQSSLESGLPWPCPASLPCPRPARETERDAHRSTKGPAAEVSVDSTGHSCPLPWPLAPPSRGRLPGTPALRPWCGCHPNTQGQGFAVRPVRTGDGLSNLSEPVACPRRAALQEAGARGMLVTRHQGVTGPPGPSQPLSSP